MTKSSPRLMAGLALALCSLSFATLLSTATPALAETCPNEQFRTGPSAELPDCRAYELVTPPFKEGAPFEFKTFIGLENYIGMSSAGTTLAMVSLGNAGNGGEGLEPDSSACPPASQVATLGLDAYGRVGHIRDRIPVYNMVPESNEPAEFGYSYLGEPEAIYPTVVGQGANAHIRVLTTGIPVGAVLGIENLYLAFFGDPTADDGNPSSPNAFFTYPTDCAGGR